MSISIKSAVTDILILPRPLGFYFLGVADAES